MERREERRGRRWRLVAIVQAVVLAVVLSWVAIDRWERGTGPDGPLSQPPRLSLKRVAHSGLPGWLEDDQAAAVPAFLRSCAAWQRGADDAPLASSGAGGHARDWLETCRRAGELEPTDRAAARTFFERELLVYSVSDRARRLGLVTGYYEPTLRGSVERAPGFDHPLYRRPPELVEVDLGSFRADLDGRRIAGVVDDGRLHPFADRRAIDSGALAKRGLELLWVDDPVDLFFLHIQGSGRIEVGDGEVLRVGYDGHNGHPYFAIGRELVERGALAPEDVSMQTIRAWLQAHPDEAGAVMARNPSFVFFRPIDGDAPRGSLGVELTPERSLAVDRRYLPLGAPLWIATELPSEDERGGKGRPWRRLMVAQDTGGAIRGPLRLDVFWGPGERAADIAGRMRQEGRIWLLLPRALETDTEAWIAARQ